MTDIEKKKQLAEMCNHGVSRLDNITGKYFNGAPDDPEQKLGYPHNPEDPDEQDPHGSQFWLDSNDMDSVWEFQDTELAGHAIGYSLKADGKSEFEPGIYARRNLNNPERFGARCANGYENGVNCLFNGVIDSDNFTKGDFNCLNMDNYDMHTSGQNRELVTDQVPKANVDEEEWRVFYNPQEKVEELKAQGEMLKNAPEAKQEQIDIHNDSVKSYNNRIDAEKNI